MSIKNIRAKNTRGFTLAEVILTVGVMAVLVTITMPTLINFMRQRDIGEEQLAQLGIRNAMVGMLAEKSFLPDDSATGNAAWYNQLARYSNLSPAQIQFDQWRNPRAYVMKAIPQLINDTSVTVYYATLHSRGPNVIATPLLDSTSNTIVPVSGNGYAALTDTGWWKNKSDSTAIIAAFSSVGIPTGVDDILTRFTDYPNKISAYNDTQTRLSRVAQALENYSKARYTERVAACSVATPPADCATYPPEKQVHYPAGADGTSTFVPDSSFYNQAVLTATAVQNNNSNQFFNNSTDNPSRRTGMVNLMRLLGLPDDYCCSAIETYTDGSGNLVPLPFYYFSNPRTRNANGTSCGTRPALNDAKLPARLTTGFTADGTLGATCG